MVDYILFEKKAEGERPAWTYETVLTFCEEEKYSPIKITEEHEFIVLQMTTDTAEAERIRMLEVTPTITFLIRDDPSLDSFLRPEYETLLTKNDKEPLKNLVIEDLKICE
jgi:hypothetical protein